MSKQIENTLGIANPSSLPQWMTCPQPDYNNPGEYFVPIGYVRAVVLAYTVPGASKLIAYRLKNANFQFNRIPFRTDRYQLDNYLSKNYDIDLEKFLVGEVTHVDQVPSTAETYQFKGTVHYAVDSNYEDLMYTHINTVRENHWIDSYNDFVDGHTLIFVNPSQFPDTVPGYHQQLMEGATNQRSAVYKIHINPDTYIMHLTLERLTEPGDIVDIKYGYLYGGKRFAFDNYIKHGSELQWWPFNKQPYYDIITGENLLFEHKPTTFDRDTTRFVSNKDQYAGPEKDAKYIKFPKIGVFI